MAKYKKTDNIKIWSNWSAHILDKEWESGRIHWFDHFGKLFGNFSCSKIHACCMTQQPPSKINEYKCLAEDTPSGHGGVHLRSRVCILYKQGHGSIPAPKKQTKQTKNIPNVYSSFFIRAPNWKLLKYPPMVEWANKF